MSFIVAHLSDPHLGPVPMPKLGEWTAKRLMGFINWKRGRERLNDMSMLANLVADLRNQSPDHIAMTGDAVNIGLPAEFGPAAAWMRTLGSQEDVSFTPGNHDAYVATAVPHLMTTFAAWTRSDGGMNSPRTFPFLRVRREVALIGLCSGVPTGPLVANGRLGSAQLANLGAMLSETRALGLARVIMIHHPPLAGSNSMRSLVDAQEFERIVRAQGAEAILHGHNHKTLVRFLRSDCAQTSDGRIIVAGVQSASSTSPDPRKRAAYHLISLTRERADWKVSIRARGLMPNSSQIGEREPVYC
jgi:3',5'-cyclic AMP phosphodiesterase CpdA